MGRQAVWVHGYSGVLQWPGGKGDPVPGNHTVLHQMDGVTDPEIFRSNIEWSDIVGLPHPELRDGARAVGAGKSWRGREGNDNRIYFSIPNVSAWAEARLVSIAFLFTADIGAMITELRAFDGPFGIELPFSIGSVSDVHEEPQEGFNYFVFDNRGIPLRFGLGLMFKVEFTSGENDKGHITFHAVGAEFEVP